ncbi:hybrid sensor histidine kinase/response regulator [Candidatus Gracilibacteria bacterium]|nr:hybrid sensor histidine kinase/response regulator [Candidatus Gracilibacteria bacterium]
MNTTANILVVDDHAANLGLLFHALERAGYTVRVVNSGELALESARLATPDLILLDVMMPHLDGFETCRRLKSDPLTRDVPVLFLTARTDPVDEVTGLQVGAVDYITKPVQIETTLARIHTHLTLRRLQQTLQQQNSDLDAYARSVAHDLKTPLTTIIAAAQMILLNPEGAAPSVKHYATMIRRAGGSANTTIHELLALAGVRKADIVLLPLDMAAILERALDRMNMVLEEQAVEVVLPDCWPAALGHAPWVELIWTNYLSNGLKYGGRPPQLTVGATEQADGMLRFWVKDNGPGLTPEARAQLFVEWRRLHAGPEEGHGLGLVLVRRMAERLNGTVGVEQAQDGGSIFYFNLPRAH